MAEEDTVAAAVRQLAPRLAVLRAVAADEHVTHVAQTLGVPQPTVSRWLAELAALLDVPLLVRDGRRVRLTRAGRELAEASGAALAALETGVRSAVEEHDPRSGRVVFAFLHTMGGVQVPELLRAFRRDHPRVRFALQQAGHAEMVRRVLAGAVDLALTGPLPTDDDRLATALLQRQRLVVAVPAGHRLADRRRVRLPELSGDEFVGLKPGYGLRQITDDLCAAAGFTPRLSCVGEEVDTIRGLVAAGLGVAVLPPSVPRPPRGMVELALTPHAVRTIGLVWPADRPLSPAAVRFRDFARDRGL